MARTKKRQINFRPWPDLEVRETRDHGRGVFARREFRAGETIELAPLIHLSADDHKRLMKTELIRYVFDAGDDTAAIGLGFTSLYNHSAAANAEFEIDPFHKQIRIVALTVITSEDEVTLDYGYHPAQAATWDPEYAEYEKRRKIEARKQKSPPR